MKKSTVAEIIIQTSTEMWEELHEKYMPYPTMKVCLDVARNYYKKWNFPRELPVARQISTGALVSAGSRGATRFFCLFQIQTCRSLLSPESRPDRLVYTIRPCPIISGLVVVVFLPSKFTSACGYRIGWSIYCFRNTINSVGLCGMGFIFISNYYCVKPSLYLSWLARQTFNNDVFRCGVFLCSK